MYRVGKMENVFMFKQRVVSLLPRTVIVLFHDSDVVGQPVVVHTNTIESTEAVWAW